MLVDFLSNWKGTSTTTSHPFAFPNNYLPARMEQLWIDLYERGYIELEDVRVVQLWLGALQQVQYEFPTTTSSTTTTGTSTATRRHSNVALMGQFNYADSVDTVDNVVFWTQKWRQLFDTVLVKGPFSNTQLDQLRAHDISATRGRNDKGFYSPIENLMRALQHYKNSSAIKGVLYLHDDVLLNLQELTTTRGSSHSFFPTHDIIASSLGKYGGIPNPRDISYQDPRIIQDKKLLSEFAYRIYPNGTVCDEERTLCYKGVHKLWREKPLDHGWTVTGKDHCGGGQKRLAKNPASAKFREEDDNSILFGSYTQSDFLFVPTNLANALSEAALLHLDAKVYLECAMGTIVDWLRQHAHATVRITPLCQLWSPEKRGRPEIVHICRNESSVKHALYHPIEIGFGTKGWDAIFDFVASSEATTNATV
jgi:hypothetical protein